MSDLPLKFTVAEAKAILEVHPVCGHCELKPAACLGNYGEDDGAPGDHFACNDCCQHGNEDGWCVKLADIPEWTVGIDKLIAKLQAQAEQGETLIKIAKEWRKKVKLSPATPETARLIAAIDALS